MSWVIGMKSSRAGPDLLPEGVLATFYTTRTALRPGAKLADQTRLRYAIPGGTP